MCTIQFFCVLQCHSAVLIVTVRALMCGGDRQLKQPWELAFRIHSAPRSRPFCLTILKVLEKCSESA